MKKLVLIGALMATICSFLVVGCQSTGSSVPGASANYDPNPDHVPHVSDFVVEK